MKRKLAFILKGYPRVSETFIAQEIWLLEQRGYAIDIFSMRKAREPERQPIVEKIKAPVTYVPEYIFKEPLTILQENLKVLLKRPMRYLKVFLGALVKTMRLGKRDPMKRFLQGAWLVGRQNLLSQNYHLHSHFIHAPTEMTWYMAQLTGLNYSISAHAKDIYTIPKEEVVQRINDSQFLTTCTRFNFEFLKALPRIDKDKVFLSYHGIDTEVFRPSTKPCLWSENPYLFSSVGRLVEKKGYDIIFRALKILKEKQIPFSYEIFGQGELKDSLQTLVEDMGLQSHVKFHFTATHPQIIERFKQKGLFLCGSKITSSGDRDGIPNTVAEAMSMELPVVATQVSGIPELIKDQESGCLIPSENPEAMAEAIEKLIQNPDLAEKIGKQGRRRVQEFFDARRCIGSIDDLLKPCLHGLD